MGTLTIKTNHQPRDLIALADIPAEYRADFDYIAADDAYTPRLFAYRGHYYDAHEFMRTPRDEAARQELNALAAWDGYQSDSYFSGVVIRYPHDATWGADFGRVIVGTYFS